MKFADMPPKAQRRIFVWIDIALLLSAFCLGAWLF